MTSVLVDHPQPMHLRTHEQDYEDERKENRDIPASASDSFAISIQPLTVPTTTKTPTKRGRKMAQKDVEMKTDEQTQSPTVVTTAAVSTDDDTTMTDASLLPTPSPTPSPSPSDALNDSMSSTDENHTNEEDESKSATKTKNSLFGGPKIKRYYEAMPELARETKQVQWIYRGVNFMTELFFGVDKELDHLPEKRKSNPPQNKSGAEYLQPTTSFLPPAISAGYGELAQGGFDKLLYWMQHEAPPELRLTDKSRFLDIGSGFGKCVFHAKLRAKVARSIGIECIKTRHEKALEAGFGLRAGFIPGLSDQKDAPSFEEVRDLKLDGCELFLGDISQPMFHPLMFAATHIYAFDVVFSKDTHAKILPIVEQSPFLLFGCYLGPAKLAAFGCTKFEFLHKSSVRTTGGQSFTCFFYRRKADDTPVPDLLQGQDPSTEQFWTNLRTTTEAAPPEQYLVEALADREKPKLPSTAAAAATTSAKKSVSASPSSSPIPDDEPLISYLSPDRRRKSSSSSSKKKKSSAASSSTTTTSLTVPHPVIHLKKKKQKRLTRKKPTISKATKAAMWNEQHAADSKKSRKRKSTSTKKKKPAVVEDETDEDETEDDDSEAESSSEEEEEEEEAKPVVPVKKGPTRGQLFDMALAAALAAKPKQQRRTNSSLAWKLEPLPESEFPKQLSQYLITPEKEPEPIVLDENMPPIKIESTTPTTATTTPATADTLESPPKKQKLTK